MSPRHLLSVCLSVVLVSFCTDPELQPPNVADDDDVLLTDSGEDVGINEDPVPGDGLFEPFEDTTLDGDDDLAADTHNEIPLADMSSGDSTPDESSSDIVDRDESELTPDGTPDVTTDLLTLADRDGDGVVDIIDNCPEIANESQADRDRDETGDVCDNCEWFYNPDQRDYNDDGTGDLCDFTTPDPCTLAYDPYPPRNPSSYCRDELPLPDDMAIYVYRNLPLDPGDEGSYPHIHRAVIVQHGNGRTAYSYFNRINDAAREAGAHRNTIVIAPHFQIDTDFTACFDDGMCLDEVPEDFHYWTSGDWKGGWDSLIHSDESDPTISSFEVLDRIILEYLINRDWYPNLEEIVFTGHSAGGQVAQRYAVGTLVDQHPGTTHLDFRFIVLNPSSYVYLSPERWDQTSGEPLCEPGDFPEYGFGVPDGSGCDSKYNDYRYGHDDLDEDHYMARITLEDWQTNFAARDVTYLMGDDDVDQTHEPTALDTSCSARLQGYCRWDRGRIFFTYMNEFFSPNNHHFVPVEGVGHSGGNMYLSPEGVEAIFEVPPRP